jgi:hypothetical protein
MFKVRMLTDALNHFIFVRFRHVRRMEAVALQLWDGSA